MRDSDHILCHGNGSCRIRDLCRKGIPNGNSRGAWLHVIGQNQWQDKSTEQAKAYIRDQFDKLAGTGCNTVIFFRCAPTADAVYRSELEPWSAWLTGKRGKAPSPMWGSHGVRHRGRPTSGQAWNSSAWLNPYRVTSTAKEVLPASHDSNKELHRFSDITVRFSLTPAYQENRDFIRKVIKDIVDRYDISTAYISTIISTPYPAPERKYLDDASLPQVRRRTEYTPIGAVKRRPPLSNNSPFHNHEA